MGSSGPGTVLEAEAVLGPGREGLCLRGVDVDKCTTDVWPGYSTGKEADGQPLFFPGHWLSILTPFLGRLWLRVCGVEKQKAYVLIHPAIHHFNHW